MPNTCSSTWLTPSSRVNSRARWLPWFRISRLARRATSREWPNELGLPARCCGGCRSCSRAGPGCPRSHNTPTSSVTGDEIPVATWRRAGGVATTAAESMSDTVLANLEKGHTRADIREALRIVRDAGIAFRPTWVAFTPWTTLADYFDMLDFVEAEGLIDHVDPVQYSIRLLVPPGSALVERR